MNWEAIGAVGEVIGAIAVVSTLLVLLVQVRHSTQVMAESNRLQRASALDQHASSVSRWRGRMMEDPTLARIWLTALNGEELDIEDTFRLDNLWIDFLNTQRSNYVRAKVVGEEGLARQAVLSVAMEIFNSEVFQRFWQDTRPWHALASEEYVDAIDAQLEQLEIEEHNEYRDHYRLGNYKMLSTQERLKNARGEKHESS